MKTPPRLVARMLAVTFLTVAVILSVVFIVLIVATRNRVREAETARLQAGGRVFSSLEASLQRGQLATVATLAENPTLKAALDTYVTERGFGGLAPEQEQALRLTVTQELQALASVTGADVLAIVDNDGATYASTGPLSERWPVGERIDLSTLPQPAFQSVLVLPAGAFRVTGASLRLGDRDVGSLLLAARLDRAYAEQLSAVAGAGIVISVNGGLVASTVPAAVTGALLADEESPNATRTLDGEEYAVATLLWSGAARIYTLSSIDEAAREQTRTALRALATVALGSFILAGFCSLWLARTLSRPIDRVSGSIAAMAATREFDRTLEPTGSSRELDALTAAFNGLMRDVVTARAETQAAYLGAIRALAAALDARDPYTAGHSERVSALSVRIARHLGLEEDAVGLPVMAGTGSMLQSIVMGAGQVMLTWLFMAASGQRASSRARMRPVHFLSGERD